MSFRLKSCQPMAKEVQLSLPLDWKIIAVFVKVQCLCTEETIYSLSLIAINFKISTAALVSSLTVIILVRRVS